MQKFHRDDHVKVVGDYSTGLMFTLKKPEGCVIPSPYAGKEAVVVASYSDQFGQPNTGGGYTLLFRASGEVSWFPEEAMTLIKENSGLLQQWEHERDEEIKLKSDLDWIFSHGLNVIEEPNGASIQALANCFGLTNLWGSRGEGITYYTNFYMTIEMASNFLKSSDKTGWLEYCKELTTRI